MFFTPQENLRKDAGLLEANAKVDTHDRSTRFSNLNFNCPRYKNETEGGRTFTVRSIKEWNNLDKDLKELKSAKALKMKVINGLLSKQKSNMNLL